MPFKCLENCSACCGPVPLSMEFLTLNGEKYQSDRFKLVDDYYPLCDDFKCIFLNRTANKCMVYESRPKVCRDFGMIDFDVLMLCPYQKPNGNKWSSGMQKRIDRQVRHKIDERMRK